ncbi:MAG: adenosylcobinamide-phosphate synthase CbiB [Pseudomonadota bacterium]
MLAAMPQLVPEAAIDPLFILMAALALDAVIGDLPAVFRHVPHPVAALGRLIGALERRLNRAQRGQAMLTARGAALAMAVAALALAMGWLVLVLTRRFAWGWAVELALAAILIAQRSLYDHVAAVERALEVGGLAGARLAVGHIVGRDTGGLDEHGVARAAIESLAENFCDGVVAPAFWYVVLGLPGLLAYKAVNTLDSMIGHRSPRYLAFGAAAARLDTALSFIPARLSGLVLAMAALVAPTARPLAALKVMVRDAAKHRSANAGWPEGAVAGALGLALAGPRRYGEEPVNDPWIGDGRARAGPPDIRRALYLYAVACLVHAALIGALALGLAAWRA